MLAAVVLVGSLGLLGPRAAAHMDFLAERRAYAQHHKMSLDDCADAMERRGFLRRAAEERVRFVRDLGVFPDHWQDIMEGVQDGPSQSPLDTDHSDKTGHITPTTEWEALYEQFKGTGRSGTVLAPDLSEGPFYIEGEYITRDVTFGQAGVPLYLHLGVYDSHTCEPLPAGTLVEIWGANATGTYSGVGVDGDPDNVHTHFLRGLQPLSDAGSTWFRTIFPGHYASRTNHVHLLVHVPDPAATQTFANGTVAGHLATWTGQLFFDQALIDAVETVPPYSSNTLPMTKNAADVFLANEAVGGSESLWDPMVEWAWVDGAQKARSGVVAWIALGVNVSEARSVEVVGVYSG